MKYHYFYKITNKIDGKFYFGVHNTDNLSDGYMGSGKVLHRAYEKYGMENFDKEILKFFDSTDEAFAYEREIVNENMIKDPQCYNVQIGGRYFCTNGMVSVKDDNGNRFWVSKEEYFFREDVHAIWEGKHHKESSKEKTRLKMTPENSTNDRVWVNKDGKVKYLRKVYLSQYQSNGWKLGRTGYKPRKNKQGTKIE